jgi:oligopeptidase B
MTAQVLPPPIARRVPKTDTIHGDTRVDDYFWLREKSSPEVHAYLEAENAYTEAAMRPTEALQQTLFEEMKGRIQETDQEVPYRQGDYFYYDRTEEGKQYAIHCRKRESLEAEEQVTLDLNALAEGHTFLGLGAYDVSDDGSLLAYATDTTGFRQFTLFVKDLRTGTLLPDRIEKVVSAVWAADNRTLFYTQEDSAKRSYRLYRHRLGDAEDALIYEEADALFRIFAARSRSKAYLFLNSASSDTTEVRILRADRPEDDFAVLLPRETGHRYYLDHHSDRFYIRTDRGAKNFRIVSTPLTDPHPENWTEIVPHDPAIKRQGLAVFAGHAVISERENGLDQLRVIDLRSREEHRISFPEPVYAVALENNPEFETGIVRFQYQSPVTPASIFDYDMETRRRTLLKQTPVRGGYDPTQYTCERLYAPASDGTSIPLSIVYKKGRARDGSAPLLLYAYGSYGHAISPAFSSNRLSLLDRGVIYAIAHIRGGGELGEDWRQAGKMLCKRNTFTDFIAAAEHLIAEKYTSSERLAIQGGSAGGLLMSAVTNMRPDLFQAVLAAVPFMDVLNTMLDPTLPLTIGEYLEWGNPNIPAEYEYMKTYCPYTNLEAKAYPAMLVKASYNDSQVMYWEAAKYVAKLRRLKTDGNPLLLKTNMGAGHGGASGRYDALKETAFDYAFLLSYLTPPHDLGPLRA